MKKKVPPAQSAQPVSKNTRPTISPERQMVLACLTLAAIAYLPALSAGFIENWDDNYYVTQNALVKNFDLGGLLTANVQGNYHPLTMWSLALNHAISGESAWSYHMLNLLLHLANTWLVFGLARSLSGKPWLAFFVAAIWTIHPMHVESVAWVSERKDVLYAFFYFLGLKVYLAHLDEDSSNAIFSKKMGVVVGVFLLSLLSKASAVVFPLSLLAIDFWKNRPMSARLFLEKIPLFALSLVFGFLAIRAQAEQGAIDLAEPFSLPDRILFACYGLGYYAVKLFLPFGLGPFHGFPPVNEALPPVFWLGAGFVLAVLAFLFSPWRKRYPALAFGLIFYIVNLLFVLQFKTVGSALVAERYSYVPHFGLLFALGYGFWHFFERQPLLAKAVGGVVVLVFAGLTFRQAQCWENAESLWECAVQSSPSGRAHATRASLYRKEGNNPRALEHYTAAIQADAADFESLASRGNVNTTLGNTAAALDDYARAITLQPNYAPTYDNRGVVYGQQKQFELAMADFNKAIELDPRFASPYWNRSITEANLGQLAAALADALKAKELGSPVPEEYIRQLQAAQ